jgi:hypothetical protein
MLAKWQITFPQSRNKLSKILDALFSANEYLHPTGITHEVGLVILVCPFPSSLLHKKHGIFAIQMSSTLRLVLTAAGLVECFLGHQSSLYDLPD